MSKMWIFFSIYNLLHCTLGAVEMRWVDTYFPFTNPSFELEIYFKVYYVHYCFLNETCSHSSCHWFFHVLLLSFYFSEIK